MVWVLIALAVILLVDLLVRLAAIRVALPIFERTPPLGAAAYPPDPRGVEFSVPSGGLTLRCCLIYPETAPRGVILFCPEFGSDRWSSLYYCEHLLEHGFALCSFDFRNQGESERMPGYEPLHWPTEFEYQDAAAVLDAIQERPDVGELPMGVFGVSRGASVALVLASRRPELACAASDGAFPVEGMMLYFVRRWAQLFVRPWLLKLIPLWHVRLTMLALRVASQRQRGCIYLNLERALVRLRGRPVLLISGERDTYVTPVITRQLHALQQGGHQSLWIAPAAGHNRARKFARESYDELLLSHFLRAMSLESTPGEAVYHPPVPGRLSP